MSRFKDIDWSTILVEERNNPTFPENRRNDVDLAKKDELQRQLNEKRRKESKEGDVELKIRRILIAPLLLLEMMGLSENQAKIIYFSLIGVGGYFAYKKFK